MQSQYKIISLKKVELQELTSFNSVAEYLPQNFSDNLELLTAIIFHNKTIAKGIILCLPNATGHEMFHVEYILQNVDKNLCVVARDITNFILYADDFQSYHLSEIYNSQNILSKWKCFIPCDLSLCSVTHIVTSGDSRKYIVKRSI